ncbi:tRNA 5-methoxyuridine(34)/uridine 5-oxyacetic acid(34) synthase CmoB [Thiovibrio frasassiensis]|uniref:tRNA 5-methoxyuridine(34)/uridine 5-oxyacetic acid(34) synthase CmoB n=1 Tax=Thiovibrio frasassiensis TaxID=2984131 RepID=A0A9X4RQJ1_9BACT|nr:tRNA 5-methoxyuridine(34)/uridine 5-oxyacetic acid(34) synthase CmoB [Thiovibrio frasassiensis]MDG4476317.1 tRNA 5-methoxyuridine(34)/uridine 5-oxyacetic acid(34) synthase CmoB [Thiovibrio frasassiensis]
MREYLDLLKTADKDAILTRRAETANRLAQTKKGFLRFREPYEALHHLQAQFTDFSKDAVTIGRGTELSEADRHLVHDAMRAFMPWRKGPFDVFGVEIDAEWQSWRKWNRLLPALPDLTGKVVADIGCNNGYYMFRMLPHKPRCVVGLEPFLQHYYCFKTLRHLAGAEELFIELMGVEDIPLFPSCFDVVFLMGIIYHRISPVEMLREIRAAMRPGGVLILESQAIPGENPVALFPEARYAKVPGTYFVPTASCLRNWLLRTGFGEVEIFCSHPMSSEEQRKTAWMAFESYEDFLDPHNPNLTVEGYPAPLRVFLRATAPS